jgi:predicted CopG family antitoxin
MNTTIAISQEIRDQIKEYGNKGETYDDILARILNSAKERQLQELLMDEKGTITIDEALTRAKKRWQK